MRELTLSAPLSQIASAFADMSQSAKLFSIRQQVEVVLFEPLAQSVERVQTFKSHRINCRFVVNTLP